MELIAKKVVTYKDLVAWDKNPRSAPDKVRLEELVASIREKGILDPLLCRTGPDGHRVDGGLLEVINGGRRLAAAQALKLDRVQREINRAFALLELNCSDSIFRKIRAKTKDANPGALADYLQAAVETEKKQAKKGGRTWKELEVQVGTCRVCGCTEDAACPGGCSWADKTKTLCSRCAKKPAKSISRKTATKK